MTDRSMNERLMKSDDNDRRPEQSKQSPVASHDDNKGLSLFFYTSDEVYLSVVNTYHHTETAVRVSGIQEGISTRRTL